MWCFCTFKIWSLIISGLSSASNGSVSTQLSIENHSPQSWEIWANTYKFYIPINRNQVCERTCQKT